MTGTNIAPPYRAISLIALIQAGVIVGGTLFVTVMLKLHGYKGGLLPDNLFNSGKVLIRDWGFTLLLIPVAWASVAIVVAGLEAPRWLLLATLWLGIAGILFGIYCYIDLGMSR